MAADGEAVGESTFYALQSEDASLPVRKRHPAEPLDICYVTHYAIL